MSKDTPFHSSEAPVVIEAAITPLRKGAPVQEAQETIREAKACLAAGAAIIHHHHDFRQDRDSAIKEIIGVGKDILADYPSARIYADKLRGEAIDAKFAHVQPMADAGVLRMFSLDPGLTVFARMDTHGLPSDSITGGTTYADTNRLVEFANRVDVPISLGVYEPGNLRWIYAYATAGKFPPGTIIKLYFGGEYMMGWDKQPGVTFGMRPTKAALDMYLSMMEGIDLPWIVSVQGGALLDMPIARYALERGGHLRVGVEDPCGGTEMTNRETVEAAIALAKRVGRPVAQGAEAIAVLAEPRAL